MNELMLVWLLNNPEVNNPSCNNLLADSSYCVQAVGDIVTYSGYGGYSNPCITSVPLPSGCIATAVTTTDSTWVFSTYTTNTTQPIRLPLAPGTWSNCSSYTQYIAPVRNTSTINSCYVVASIYEVDVTDFVSWNPSLSYDEDTDDPNDCQLIPGYQYCLQLTKPTATPTTTTRRTVTSTTTSGQATSTGPNGQPTPLLIQDGMTTSCGTFYLVKIDDSCYNITTSYNIAISKLYIWNPALNGDCTGLFPNYYICVGLIGNTTATTTTTTSYGGVSTPTPTQAGMVAGCTSFYYVQSGDGCSDIATNNGIALGKLYIWNPALNEDCSGLWPNYYICVDVGTTNATTTTATTTAGAVATPTPTQAGMVSSCKSFYYVQSGNRCSDIAANNGIALSKLYIWNPALNGDCSGLWPDYYICVGV
ncbi:uncharacterized protein BDW43DRAFT_314545 [Aspergillus alliaceus]|uniref:uncharacterized protein n=1 Tax=Petromyces alliaceus TaxID=209559 RepID=UPI0012A7144D|nr:uncharacterized protein BDW43DRAFT_314545 [Aspergillus alliaceus]KAB8229898.1 hypothetical protein BDW43DRAFT_314545 [Aspergillus alliaceus]